MLSSKHRRNAGSSTIEFVLIASLFLVPLLLGLLWKQTMERYADSELDLAALARAHLDVLLNGLLRKKASS